MASQSNRASLKIALDRLLASQTEVGPDQLLEAFVAYVEARGLALYDGQEEAILELFSESHVVLSTPTGSGKSLVAVALHFDALARGQRSVYTSPIKALVNEKFFDLCQIFGPQRVGLATGDASVNANAEVICCTQEVFAGLALRGGAKIRQVGQAVVDEFHYYGDPERGMAWQLPLITLPNTRFLLMSATLGNLAPTMEALERFSGRPVVEVHRNERPVPLSWRYTEAPLHETVQELLDTDEAPIYLVSFTQRACLEEAQALTSLKLLNKEQKVAIQEALVGERFDTPFGKVLSRLLKHGVGLHHGGLVPRYRRLVERLAQQGLLRVLSGTDTLGVGVNIPLRTVLLTGLCKFDGTKMRRLSSRELHQIAGRAGRKGFDDHGNVVVQAPPHVIENKRTDAKLARRPELARKLKKTPAPKGFVPWDEAVLTQIRERPPEALEGVFDLDFGLILTMLQVGAEDPDGGVRGLLSLIAQAHLTTGQKQFQKRQLATRLRALREADVVSLQRREPARPESKARLLLAEGLDSSFSLDDALGLYRLAAIESLRSADGAAGQHDEVACALIALSVVEATLEDPRAILFRQINTLKGELVAKLKAEGVPYDERMQRLEEVEAPQPELEFLRATFESFARTRPWVRERGLRPKSIAREMIETGYDFNDYVRHHGLERMEGLLLRHLNGVYRGLRRGLPEALMSDALSDICQTLENTLRRVDSSLLDEWEAMRGVIEIAPGERLAVLEALSAEGAAAVVKVMQGEATPGLAAELAAQPRRLARMVRAELHTLLGLLARGRYEAAAASLPEEPKAWSAEELRQSVEAFVAVNGALDASPRGRAPWHTKLQAEEGLQWKVQQTLCAVMKTPEVAFAGERAALAGVPSDDDEPLEHETGWALVGLVDLSCPAEGRPLFSLIRLDSL